MASPNPTSNDGVSRPRCTLPEDVIEVQANYAWYWCPGCEEWHMISVRGPKAWDWNRSTNVPTFKPSVLVQGAIAEVKTRCHHYVTDGRIQYLADCTHSKAGTTVDMVKIVDFEPMNLKEADEDERP